MKILLTVPHSLCIKNSRRNCDYLADDASMNLDKNFRKLHKAITYRIKADKNRNAIDYNRKIARNSRWRVFVRKIMLDESVDVLLDIHSFPSEYSSFGYFSTESTPSNFSTEYTKIIPEVVILDSYHSNNKFLDYNTSINFNKYLLKYKILSKLLVGGENDIIMDGRKKGIPSVLIEYNESLSKERLNFINKIIAKYMVSLY